MLKLRFAGFAARGLPAARPLSAVRLLSAAGLLPALGLAAACSGEATAPMPSVPPDSPIAGSAGAGTAAGGASPVGGGGDSAMADDDFPVIPNPDGSLTLPMVLTGDGLSTQFARLTNDQWRRAVRDLLNLEALPEQESLFFESAPTGATDFVNAQQLLLVTNTQWGQYQKAAETIAARVSETDEAMQRVFAGTDADAFIRDFGMKAFRRPVTEDEVVRYQGVFDTGAALEGTQSAFTRGAGLVIETMLQSPHFLYRIEMTPPGQTLSGYELAAKLSLYLLRTIPSDALMEKAASGALDSAAGIEAEARAMLATPEAAETFSAFHYELLELSRFKDIAKTDPAFTEDVAGELVEASRLFFERLYAQDQGVREMLTTRTGFIGPATAPFYGLPAPAGMEETTLPEERVGFFTQLPYLMNFARGNQSYAVLRGVHINTEVLCAKLPPLPTAPPPLPDIEYTTSREYMELGTLPCGGGCHDTYINALGYAMENFDGLGRTRDLDNGYPIDTASSYPFLGGIQNFKDSKELMAIISENKMAHECYARHIASYGLGRDLGDSDWPVVNTLADFSLNQNASTKELVVKLVTDPAFYTRSGAN